MEIGKPLRTVETTRTPIRIAVPDWPKKPEEKPIPVPNWPQREPAEKPQEVEHESL